MNDRTNGRTHSYYEAPKAAMEMVEHLPPQQFFSEIPKGSGKYILTWEGVRILIGLMHVSIESISHKDTADVLEVECVAVNPNQEKGFSFISQPFIKKERGKEEDDEDYREKAFSRAKRNACRDLVPDQVFCGLLVEKWKSMRGGTQQNNAGQPAENGTKMLNGETFELIEHRQRARTIASYEKEYLQDLHGITVGDVIKYAETALDKPQKDWNDPNQWAYLADCLQKPKEMGMEVANDDKNTDALKEAAQEVSEEPAETDNTAKTQEESDDELQQVMADIGG